MFRHFNIRLEYDFFEALAAACDPTAFPHCTALQHQALLSQLAHILLNAPQLSSFCAQIPDNNADSCASAWTQLLRLNAQGLALGSALARVLPQNTTFPALRTLHLDGVSHLTSLVRMTPNLTSLSAHMCEGFSETASRELIEGTLPLVSRLEELAFDPFSLQFAGSGLNVPKAIVAAAPGLRVLDLRSRAFDYGTGRTEWRTTDRIVSQFDSRVSEPTSHIYFVTGPSRLCPCRLEIERATCAICSFCGCLGVAQGEHQQGARSRTFGSCPARKRLASREGVLAAC